MQVDIAKLQAENERLKKTVEDLWTINHLARIIGSTMPVKEVLDAVVAASLKAVGAEQGTISLLNEKEEQEDEGDAAFKTLIRKVDTSTPGSQFRLDEKLSDWMIKHRKPLVINHVNDDTALKGLSLVRQKIQSILSIPLLCKGKLIGVVNIFNKKGNEGFTKDDQRLLAIIASQSAQTIENARLYAEEKQLKRYEHELDLSRKIQHGLIPKTVPENDGIEVASYFQPAHKVGGDYFDYFELSENRLGIVMADVSGHGPAAALVMTMVKGIIHAMTVEFDSPDLILAEINSILDRIGPKDMFVTMVFMVIDSAQKKIQFSNAGHNPILHYDHRAERCAMVELMGPALSITSLSKYGLKEIALNTGDVILIYTDGVTEAFNPEGQMFQESRLSQAVQGSGQNTAESVIERVRLSLDEFTSEAPQSDDIAIIAVKAS
ncbi:SpoIIE family protein phosphatase [bacterium]|nr:SpoIIE family protein phosphatase [bacterium]